MRANKNQPGTLTPSAQLTLGDTQLGRRLTTSQSLINAKKRGEKPYLTAQQPNYQSISSSRASPTNPLANALQCGCRRYRALGRHHGSWGSGHLADRHV